METGSETESLILLDSKDIDWKDLDPLKLYLNSSFFFFVVRTIVYPAILVKTRLQSQREKTYNGTLDCFRKVIQREGLKGLYRGYLTTSIGILPSQIMYITSLEFVRSLFPKDNSNFSLFRNFVAGACASLASTSVTVPLDVITQRLMVQDGKNNFSYRGGLHAFSKILKDEGLKGLYRGYRATLMTYIPSGALWWGTYFIVKPKISKLQIFPHEVFVHALAGLCAGVTAATITNPLDVAKTRLQVSTTKGQSVLSIWREIIQKDGLKSLLSRGLSARLLNVIPTSLLSVTIYEQVKTLSVKDQLKLKKRS